MTVDMAAVSARLHTFTRVPTLVNKALYRRAADEHMCMYVHVCARLRCHVYMAKPTTSHPSCPHRHMCATYPVGQELLVDVEAVHRLLHCPRIHQAVHKCRQLLAHAVDPRDCLHAWGGHSRRPLQQSAATSLHLHQAFQCSMQPWKLACTGHMVPSWQLQLGLAGVASGLHATFQVQQHLSVGPGHCTAQHRP